MTTRLTVCRSPPFAVLTRHTHFGHHGNWDVEVVVAQHRSGAARRGSRLVVGVDGHAARGDGCRSAAPSE
eukprot:2976983-Pleurochrysis_carterae.AAC.1